MHSLYLFTFFTLFLTRSLSLTTTFYIDGTSKKNFTDGSRSNPFTSLYEATLGLSTGTFDIILLSQGVTITSQVIFPEGSICTIKPETVPESSFYPLRLDIGGSIMIQRANVTFQNIQLIELDLFRDPLTNAITVSAGSVLFLNRVLVSDFEYQDTSHGFISLGDKDLAGTALLLLDCQFKNLRYVQIQALLTQITIQNTIFDNIDRGLFSLDVLDTPNMSFRMLNTSLMNSGGGFVYFSGSFANVSIEGFSAKNISIQNRDSLIGMDVSLDTFPRSVSIWNVVLEDIVEINDLSESERYECGYEYYCTKIANIFELTGTEDITVRNLTARNVKFEGGSLLSYRRLTNEYGNPDSPAKKILLRDIKIENSSNTSFILDFPRNITVENVELVNVESKVFPMFSFTDSLIVAFKNIEGRNISGSLISLDGVFKQNLKNFILSHVSISQESFPLRTHKLILFTGDIEPSDYRSVFIDDFFIDGYEYIETEDEKQNAYLISVEADVGAVWIRDSIWSNIMTQGVFILKRNALSVENLTVNGESVQAADIANS